MIVDPRRFAEGVETGAAVGLADAAGTDAAEKGRSR